LPAGKNSSSGCAPGQDLLAAGVWERKKEFVGVCLALLSRFLLDVGSHDRE
jgi:hypothetical protein